MAHNIASYTSEFISRLELNESLIHNARFSPCTAVLNEVMAKTNQQSTVLVISNQNHDAETLAFNLQALTIKGNAVISVLV